MQHNEIKIVTKTETNETMYQLTLTWAEQLHIWKLNEKNSHSNMSSYSPYHAQCNPGGLFY